MPKHIRRKKTTSPARAKPRAVAAAPVAPARPPAAQAKAKPAKKRGRRRGLLAGLGSHEHERDILDQYLHEVSKTPLLTQKEEIALARKVDPDQGVKFISYAVWWIRQAILAALARQGRTVRVPLNRTADLSRIVR